jgi:hypothetical protein
VLGVWRRVGAGRESVDMRLGVSLDEYSGVEGSSARSSFRWVYDLYEVN